MTDTASLSLESKSYTEIPPTRLTRSDVERLGKLMSTNEESNSTEIQISYGDGFTSTYDDVQHLLSDPNAPKVVHNIEWFVRGRTRNKVEGDSVSTIRFYYSGDEGSLRIQGPKAMWVKSKKTELLEFIKGCRSKFIGFFKRSFMQPLAFGLMTLSVIFALIFPDNLKLTIGLLLLFLLGISLFSVNVQKISPNFTIELEEIKYQHLGQQIIIGIISSLLVSAILYLVYLFA